MIDIKTPGRGRCFLRLLLLFLVDELLFVLFPKRSKLPLENCQNDTVGATAVAVAMFPLNAFNHIAAFLKTTLASWIEVIDFSRNLVEIESVEGVFQKHHLGFRAVPLTP